MSAEKRLGRGLSDVSRLFLSEAGGDDDRTEKSPDERSGAAHAPRRARAAQGSGDSNGVRVLGVACAAEGIQKSFLTINLAIELAKLDMRVVIVDADTSAPNVGFLMGVPAGHVFDRLERADSRPESRCLEGPLGIRVILMGDDPGKIFSLDREALVRDAREIAADVGVVIINAPPVRRGIACASWPLCTHLLVLTPPEIPGMMDAYRLLKTAAVAGVDTCVGTVVTGAGTAVEGRAIYEKMASVARRHLGLALVNYGFVFDDVRIYESVWRQEPVALAYTDSTSARCIKEIAEVVLNAGSGDDDSEKGRWEEPGTDDGEKN